MRRQGVSNKVVLWFRWITRVTLPAASGITGSFVSRLRWIAPARTYHWSASSFCRLEIFPLYPFDNSFVSFYSSLASLLSYLVFVRLYSHREWLRGIHRKLLSARLYYSESVLEMRFTSRILETWLVYSPMKYRFTEEKDVDRQIVILTCQTTKIHNSLY